MTASTDETADFTDGMSVALVAARARQHEATGPGEIAGPAVDLKLSIVNSTQARADVDAVTVTMAYGRERTPAVPLLSAGEPFSGGLKPGASRTATYRFLVPPGTRGNVAILVTLAADQPSVQLEGDIR